MNLKHIDLMEYFVMEMERMIFMKSVQVEPASSDAISKEDIFYSYFYKPRLKDLHMCNGHTEGMREVVGYKEMRLHL